MFSYENLCVQDLDYAHIIDFSSCEKMNEHGYATVTIEIDEGKQDEMEVWNEWVPVTVFDKVSGHKLFAGVLLEAEGFWQNTSYVIEMRLGSGTCLLDREKHFYSYQNKQKYRSLLDQVLGQEAKVSFRVEDKEVPGLLVQYEESDWEFVKRLGSHFGNCVVPEIHIDNGSRFYFGWESGEDYGEIEPFDYCEKVEERFYHAKAFDKDTKKRDHLRYQIESGEDYKIGGQVTYRGSTWYIEEKTTYLADGVIKYKYSLASKKSLQWQAAENLKLHGKEIAGTVTGRKGEQLQVDLDMDKGEKKSQRPSYPWMPETGNLLYCMPEIGERVRLYFCNNHEDSAICINCARENKFPSKWVRKPGRKRFIVRKKRKLLLLKKKMEFRSLNNRFSLKDKGGISMTTDGGLQIQAGKEVYLEAPYLSVTADREIALVKEDLLTPTMIVLNGDLNAKGGDLITEEKIWYGDPEIPERVFDKGKDIDGTMDHQEILGVIARR
jgi:hypothetical protein